MRDFTIDTQADLAAAVEELGFLPLFRSDIPGFSAEEHVTPRAWFSDEPGIWEWKGPVTRENRFAYGKFFGGRAAFISEAWFPDFANFRRDGYDFDALYDEGLAPHREKQLFDLVEARGPLLSKELKELGNYRRDGNKGFDGLIAKLQARCYVLISDFVYQTDRYGREYGWGVARYATPEQFFGPDFRDRAYRREPEASFRRLLDHLKEVLPGVPEQRLEKFLKRG